MKIAKLHTEARPLILLLLLVAYPFFALGQEKITLHSIGNARYPIGDVGYTLDGERMKNSARLKLTNLKNFGDAGVYRKAVQIFDGYTTTGSLRSVTELPSRDIFFIGSFNEDSYDIVEFAEDEKDSLLAWSKRGGKLLIAPGGVIDTDGEPTEGGSWDLLGAWWNYKLVDRLPSVALPTEEGIDWGIFDGPFGEVPAASQGGVLQGYFEVIPEHSVVLATDTEYRPTLFIDCLTLDVIAADVDMFTELGGITKGGEIISNQDKFWANTIAFMDQLQQPPVITSTGATLLLNDQYNAYQWFKDGVAFSVDSIVASPDTGSYAVEVTVNGGCKVMSDTINVNCLPLPVVNLPADTLLCQGSTLNIDVFNDGAAYRWQDGSTTSTYTISSPGTYSVEVTTACGRSQGKIDVEYTEKIDLGADRTLCEGNKVTLKANLAGATYEWQDGSTGSILEVTKSGTYWVDATDSCGVQRDSIAVQFDPTFSFLFGEDTTLCPADTLILDATTGNASYKWLDGTTEPTYEVTKSGRYQVRATNTCGIRVETINVDYLDFNLGEDVVVCEGQEVSLDASFADVESYNWQDNSTQPIYTATDSKTYSVEVFHEQCGLLRDSVHISHKPNPDFTLGPDVRYCNNEPYILDATVPGATYRWHNGLTDPLFGATSPGSYSVVVTLDGCSSSDTITLTDDCIARLSLPNVFTPNNDGTNDLFVPIKQDLVSSTSTSIFDRSGNLIYQTADLAINWDGRASNGLLVEAGTYFYHVVYIDFSGKKSILKGTLTVLY